MMQLRSTTKMAIQSALAIFIGEWIALYFSPERGYWITISAMVLTAQTWGESAKRSLERVAMTILGGGVGTALYFSIPEHPSALLLGLVLVFIFLNIYTAEIYSVASVFFLTCFVVFLFALMGGWTLFLLMTRIVDTALGAVIALAVGYCLFSLKTNIDGMFIDYLQKMKALLGASFDTKAQPKTLFAAHRLMQDFKKIKKGAISVRYELVFHRLSTRDFNRLLNDTMFCTRYVIRLVESYHWLSPHLKEEERAIIMAAEKMTEHNIEVLANRLQKRSSDAMLAADYLTQLFENAIKEEPARFATLESDTLGFFSLICFFTQLNNSLNHMGCILGRGIVRLTEATAPA